MNLSDNKIAFVFPGQGSQAVGMGKDLADSYPIAKRIFQQADDLLGFSLSNLAWNGPKDLLNDTINTQPALLVHSVSVLRVLEENHPNIKPAFVAGHSLGELSALVASKSLSFEDGLKLVRRRGELMKKAGEQNPGSMAAILGLDIPQIEDVISKTGSREEPLQIANDNCPGQVVISGAESAITRAISLAEEAGARRVVPLSVSIAAHSPLMGFAQKDFNRAVNEAPISVPEIPVVGNVTAQPLMSVEDIQKDLQAQLTSPVLWTESIGFLISQGVNTFLEVGSGNVLSGLIRRINSAAIRIPLGSAEDFKVLN